VNSVVSKKIQRIFCAFFILEDIKASLEQFVKALADAPNAAEQKLQMGELNVTSI